MSALVLIFGILGIVNGVLLMLNPHGDWLGLPSEYLDRIPFHSFFPVGLWLFVIFGIIPLFLAYGLWTREEMFLGPVSQAGGIHWAWQGTWALLVVLLAWLLLEHYGYDIALAPPTYFVIGLGVVMFLLLIVPATIRFYRSAPPA